MHLSPTGWIILEYILSNGNRYCRGYTLGRGCYKGGFFNHNTTLNNSTLGYVSLGCGKNALCNVMITMTRLSHYNVTTMLDDLVGLCLFKQNVVVYNRF